MQGETIVLDKREKRKLAGEFPDLCLTCGTCAGGCPVTGVDGLDMRKAVRMALLGLDQELRFTISLDLHAVWALRGSLPHEHRPPENDADVPGQRK